MSKYKLKSNNAAGREILEAVEKQIRERTPAYVREIYIQLYVLTASERKAKEWIGAALAEEMYDMMTNAEVFNDERYRERLNRIFDRFDPEEVEITAGIARHPIAGIQWEIEAVNLEQYSGKPREYQEKEKQCAEIFWDGWNAAAREWLRQRGENGTVSIDDLGDDVIESFAVQDLIDNAEMLLYNSGMHEERISLLTDMLSFVDWEDAEIDMRNDYRGYISESLNKLGRYEEADACLEKALAEDPEDDNLILRNIIIHYDRGDYEGARELVEKQISTDDELTYDNSAYFEWAQDIYEKLGEKDKQEACEEKLKEDTETAEVLDFTVRKGQITSQAAKKVYPNDPCPCGSGKKYKKCCGATKKK